MRNPNQSKSFDVFSESSKYAFSGISFYQYLFGCLALLLLSSCEQSETGSSSNGLVDVTVSLNGFDVTQTRASDKSASEASVNRIALKVFDADDKLSGEVSQTSDSTYFGLLNFKLPVGTYKFVAVACKSKSNSPAVTINSTEEVSFGKVSVPFPVYTKEQDVTVSGNTSQSVSIDMGQRVNSLFTIKITDVTPSDVDSLQLIVNPSAPAYTDLKINPSTGLTSSSMRFAGSIAKSANSQSTFTNWPISIGLFLTSDTQLMDLTINALDASGAVLYTRTLNDVTFKRAYCTKATGSFFSSTTSGSLLFDTTIDYIDIGLE